MWIYLHSDAKSDEFSREPSFQWTMSAVDSNMFSVAGELYGSQIRSQLWTAINGEIFPQDCEIYRYNKAVYVYAYVQEAYKLYIAEESFMKVAFCNVVSVKKEFYSA